jgi:hypothetical protein
VFIPQCKVDYNRLWAALICGYYYRKQGEKTEVKRGGALAGEPAKNQSWVPKYHSKSPSPSSDN